MPGDADAAKWVDANLPGIPAAERERLVASLATLLRRHRRRPSDAYSARREYLRDYTRGRSHGVKGKNPELPGSDAYRKGYAAGTRSLG